MAKPHLKKIWPILLITGLIYILGPNGHAADLNPDEFMAVDKLKPGMKGIGKTVFSGTRIEEFQVEILAVLKNVRPKGDLILARVSGGPLDETGVIAGMSGSPVYIDGKLIGAVAYSWPFAKEPIAGITPISEMLEVFEKEETGDSGTTLLRFNSLDGLDSVRSFSDLSISGDLVDDHPYLKDYQGFALIPIRTPVTLSGFDSRVIELMSPMFSKLGLIPVQGGSGSEAMDPTDFVPGAAIGVQLVRGDATISGIGTLTYRKGDRVIAFGHPLFFAGSIDLPMTGAYVHSIMPSQVCSFRFASSIKLLGKIGQDRRAGISGTIGSLPELIPLHIRLRTDGERNSEDYQFEIIDHKLFSPLFVGWTVLNTVLSSGKARGDCALKLRMDISLGGQSTISKEDLFSGPSVPVSAADAVSRPIFLLMSNEFEEVDIEDISLTIFIEERRRTTRIEGVRINKERVRPGESLELKVFVKPYHEDGVTERIELKIPEDTPEGRVQIRVGDASSAQAWKMERLPLTHRPRNLSQLIDILEKEESNNDIIVEVFLARRGAMVKGEELPSLPPSILSVMRSSKQTGEGDLTEGTVLLKRKLSTDYVVSGSEVLPLEVNKEAK